MNWREKLAGWINNINPCNAIYEFEIQVNDLEECINDLRQQEVILRKALHEISTIHVNAKSDGMLRKAVRIAKEALK